MSDLLQNVLALSCVALAMAYLAWRGWSRLRPGSSPGGCGTGCATCPSGQSAAPGETLIPETRLLEPVSGPSRRR